jgi:hypothetical protein
MNVTELEDLATNIQNSERKHSAVADALKVLAVVKTPMRAQDIASAADVDAKHVTAILYHWIENGALRYERGVFFPVERASE